MWRKFWIRCNHSRQGHLSPRFATEGAWKSKKNRLDHRENDSRAVFFFVSQLLSDSNNFKPTEFEGFRMQAGLNAFTLSPKKWIEATGAIGIVAKSGRYGGTYAHKDVAFKFASWISVEFELYIVKEFQRLKTEEQRLLGWSAKRELSKINYRIHTDAIKQNLIPAEVTPMQANIIYANEADVLNVAMFGMTAKQWREANPDLKGNIRDYATINELICLSNMENLNAVFIEQGMTQRERLVKLNKIAIHQMSVLESGSNDRKLLK